MPWCCSLGSPVYFLDVAGGETPDQWTFLQHQGPVGNPQDFAQTDTQDRTWSVR